MAEEVGTKDQTQIADNIVGDFLYDKFNEILEKELNISAKNKIESNGQSEFLFSKEGFKNILNGLFLMRAKRENIRSGCSNIFDLSLKNFSHYQEVTVKFFC